MSSARSDGLLAWYRKAARDLPWRQTNEPYAIWISEIMLQQTQVKTVLLRYAAWFERFPDIGALADADIDAVLKAWEGLGYYRRARLLHAAARQIVARHMGRFPESFDDIVALPGIGRSTAGAIASFCFGARTPVLDGNVKRVLGRWTGNSGLTNKALWQLAQQQIDAAGDPATWNQAMMELGATCCTPRAPGCAGCPAASHCGSAFMANETVPGKRLPVQNLHWQVDLHLDTAHGIWLAQRPARGIWAGLWTPPITELAEAPDTPPCHVHLLTHRRLHLYGHLSSDRPVAEGCWIADLRQVALPTGIRRLLEKHGVAP